ncbi:MAG: hypothetical protein JWL86_4970 [Rhizobium sp.]|nr:hypothetical protein [Rhizobium sp.]
MNANAEHISRLHPQRIAAACLALFLATTASLAETTRAHDLGLYGVMEMLPGHPTVSYFDLLKQIVPDLTADKDTATGRKISTLRHIAGPDNGAGAPDVIKISQLQALNFRAQGKPAIAILVEIGEIENSVEQPVVLAVFEDNERPRLLDFVDVGMDRMTGFGTPKLLRIGPNDQAIVTHSQHFNSSESYSSLALIFVRDGKLQLVDTFSTYGMQVCNRKETQTLSFRARPAAKTAPYFDITAGLKEQRERTGETCDEKRLAPYAKTITTTYAWNPATGRFTAKSDAIKRLEKATGERL